MGIPFPKGRLLEPLAAVLSDPAGDQAPLQLSPLARWSDGSVKWLLVESLAPALPAGTSELTLSVTGGPSNQADGCGVAVELDGKTAVARTGTIAFQVDGTSSGRLLSVRREERDAAATLACGVVLTDRKGRRHVARIEQLRVETAGPVRTSMALTGRFDGCRDLRFRARLCFFSGTGLVRLGLTIHNPNRARHRGGLWDLGDPGSLTFRDLSLEIDLPSGQDGRVLWKAEVRQEPELLANGPLEIYQDSSGGENWQSRNHVNAKGRVPCRFRGYRVRSGDGERSGHRASPTVVWENGRSRLSVSSPEFWQQFPKAIEVDGDQVRVRLFPHQWDDVFELQGGEKKTHTVWLRLDAAAETSPDWLAWTHLPARAHLTPEWYAASGAIPYVSPASADRDGRLQSLMQEALSGEKSFFAGRETIDEYGWRNYGDIWANHEEAYYEGPRPVISHYNNQFDVVYGAIVQMMRTGDSQWFDVFDPLARHVMDIDIYHADRDKAAYNGGLFWFTDHYVDAGTSTHRTYSRANQPGDGRPYGGGPGAEHNFATGLLHYYYLTGNLDARDTVLGLADWVVRMDDGSGNILGILDDRPTGLASCCGSLREHGPGRGSANSINVLLDAWLLSDQECYLAKAEELIHRSIHPADDVQARDLLNAEKHWSYTMFLSALARYLDVKAEQGTLDANYAYAQQSLLRYAAWMVEHERPYLDCPEELEYLTETWPAQELRKANVLQMASRHAEPPLSEQMRARARQISDRAWQDFLGFATRGVARGVALMMKEGSLDAHFRAQGAAAAPICHGPSDFPAPPAFVPQKIQVLAQLKTISGGARLVCRLARPATWRRLLAYGRRRCWPGKRETQADLL